MWQNENNNNIGFEIFFKFYILEVVGFLLIFFITTACDILYTVLGHIFFQISVKQLIISKIGHTGYKSEIFLM